MTGVLPSSGAGSTNSSSPTGGGFRTPPQSARRAVFGRTIFIPFAVRLVVVGRHNALFLVGRVLLFLCLNRQAETHHSRHCRHRKRRKSVDALLHDHPEPSEAQRPGSGNVSAIGCQAFCIKACSECADNPSLESVGRHLRFADVHAVRSSRASQPLSGAKRAPCFCASWVSFRTIASVPRLRA